MISVCIKVSWLLLSFFESIAYLFVLFTLVIIHYSFDIFRTGSFSVLNQARLLFSFETETKPRFLGLIFESTRADLLLLRLRAEGLFDTDLS